MIQVRRASSFAVKSPDIRAPPGRDVPIHVQALDPIKRHGGFPARRASAPLHASGTGRFFRTPPAPRKTAPHTAPLRGRTRKHVAVHDKQEIPESANETCSGRRSSDGAHALRYLAD